MIQFLFWVLFAESVVAFLLMVRIGPSRVLVMKGLDQIKMGQAPATIKTVAATMFVILLSNFFSIVMIQNKGFMTPIDQVLWRTNLLEAFLIGFCLFLGFLIDGMHYYFGKLATMKVSVAPSKLGMERLENENAQLNDKVVAPSKLDMEKFEKENAQLKDKEVTPSKLDMEKLEKENVQLKDKEARAKDEIKMLKKEILALKENTYKVKLSLGEKDKRIESAETHVAALQKHFADLLLEYDHLF